MKVTTQSGQAFRSPTAVETTGSNPALLKAEEASLYFWPLTSGDELAAAAGTWPAVRGTRPTASAATTANSTSDGGFRDLDAMASGPLHLARPL
jgi:hypothetical protein